MTLEQINTAYEEEEYNSNFEVDKQPSGISEVPFKLDGTDM